MERQIYFIAVKLLKIKKNPVKLKLFIEKVLNQKPNENYKFTKKSVLFNYCHFTVGASVVVGGTGKGYFSHTDT